MCTLRFLFWVLFITKVGNSARFGIKTTSTQWNTLSFLKLTLLWGDSRYQCIVINGEIPNVDTTYLCDTTNTQTTYHCDSDSNDVGLGLQMDENQYDAVVPVFVDTIVIHFPNSAVQYNITIPTNQIYRYTLFVPSGLTTWKYIHHRSQTALCPPVATLFGFHLHPSYAFTVDPVTMTILWEQSRYQCTVYPNVDNSSIYWWCSDTTQRSTECDASINEALYAIHFDKGGKDGVAVDRILIHNRYRDRDGGEVWIEPYNIDLFYTPFPGTPDKCVGQQIYDELWLDDTPSSCNNGYPHTLVIFNNIRDQTSSQLYNAESNALCPPPTKEPTIRPTQETVSPTNHPTPHPTHLPTHLPSNIPTYQPSNIPSVHVVTSFPSETPTLNPMTATTLSHTTSVDDDDFRDASPKSNTDQYIVLVAVAVISICLITFICVCVIGFKLKRGKRAGAVYKVDEPKKGKSRVVVPHVQLQSENPETQLLWEWLETLKLTNYFDIFITNGHGSLESVRSVNKVELVRMGIREISDQQRIMTAIERLHVEKQSEGTVRTIEHPEDVSNIEFDDDCKSEPDHGPVPIAEPFGSFQEQTLPVVVPKDLESDIDAHSRREMVTAHTPQGIVHPEDVDNICVS